MTTQESGNTEHVMLPKDTTFEETDRGGAVHCNADIHVPGDVHATPSGVSFGPLFLSTPPGEVCSLLRLEFFPEDDSVLGAFIGVTAVGVAGVGEGENGSSDDLRMTRRGTLTLAACILGGAALADPVTAADDPVTFPIAEIQFTSLTGPLGVHVADLNDDVLPHTADIHVDADGARRRTAYGPRDGAMVPPDSSTATVYVEDSMGSVRELTAWARGVMAGAADVRYEFTLPQPASSYAGEELTLTKNPAIVEPVEYGGYEDTIVTVGDVSIPHRREDESSTGAYYLSNGALILRVGEGAPENDTVAIRLDAGRLATAWDNANRDLETLTN